MNPVDPSFALEIRGLARRFDQPAVDGLDFKCSDRRILHVVRAQWRGQDHDIANDLGAAEA
jgi:hypothetical protein